MSKAGASKAEMARALRCHPSTIRRHFGEGLKGKKPRGVPAREFTEPERNLVSAMVSFGIPQAEIARVLEIGVTALRTSFIEELDTGATKANASVATALYNNAVRAGSVRAQIFWLRTRAGWTDAQEELPAEPSSAPSLQQRIGTLDPEGRAALRTVLTKMGATSALSELGPKPGDPIQ
jgi:hypothetical protein